MYVCSISIKIKFIQCQGHIKQNLLQLFVYSFYYTAVQSAVWDWKELTTLGMSTESNWFYSAHDLAEHTHALSLTTYKWIETR